MATPRRSSDPSLIGRLAAQPWRFRFFQAVRLYEQRQALNARDRDTVENYTIGEEADPRQRTVRFRATTRLSYPATEIDAIEDERGLPTVTVTFMGLSGPSSVLPQHYSVTVWREFRNRNTAMRDFLDLFNDRLIAFFYRAWAKYRVPITVERNIGRDTDGVSEALRGLIGFATAGLNDRMHVAEHSLLHYAGLLSHYPRSLDGLRALISDYFGQTIQVESYDGLWLSLPPQERTRLGSSFATLGVDAFTGESFWDVQSGVAILVGPVDYAAFASFMPNGNNLQKLRDLARLYANPEISFRVEVALKRDDVPRMSLEADGAIPALLGWNTWLRHEPMSEDARDASYRI